MALTRQCMRRRMDGLRPKIADFGLIRAAVEQLSDELQRGASGGGGGSSMDRPREVSLLRSETPGTGAYMAPEILKRTGGGSSSDSVTVTTKADVYSFGIILWEMVSQQDLATAWEQAAHGRPALAVVIPRWAAQGVRPAIPSRGCEAHWQYVIEQCWQTQPEDRPSFRQCGARFFPDDPEARIEIWREAAPDTGLTDVQHWLHSIGLGRCAAPAGESLQWTELSDFERMIAASNSSSPSSGRDSTRSSNADARAARTQFAQTMELTAEEKAALFEGLRQKFGGPAHQPDRDAEESSPGRNDDGFAGHQGAVERVPALPVVEAEAEAEPQTERRLSRLGRLIPRSKKPNAKQQATSRALGNRAPPPARSLSVLDPTEVQSWLASIGLERCAVAAGESEDWCDMETYEDIIENGARLVSL